MQSAINGVETLGGISTLARLLLISRLNLRVMPLAQGLTFRSVYCARENCSREHFARAVFWKSLPKGKKVFVAALQLTRPSLFALDFELIESVSAARSLEEFESGVLLHYGGIRERSWLRDRMKLRMSLHRLRRLAIGYLPKA